MRELPLETPLYEAMGARAPLLRPLEKMGIKTVQDLLWHFPTRYEDFSKIYTIADLEAGQQATIQAAVEDIQMRRTRRGLSVVTAILADESGTIRAVWFNQPYIATTLRPGRIANFSGKVSFSEDDGIYLNSPIYEIQRSTSSEENLEATHTGRLVPVYPETQGITSRGIRFLVQRILGKNPGLSDWLPEAVRKAVAIPEIHAALQSIHFPKHIEDAMAARRRFSFEELYLLQLWNFEQKSKLAEKRAPVIPEKINRVKDILAHLPFTLTQSQKQSLWDVIQDIAKPTPMNRLLQGDVGSGKTIVAAIAAILAAEQGFQTAFMAPTEILARQHFLTMQKLLEQIPAHERLTIGLVTGSGASVFYPDGLESKISKKDFLAHTADGTILIIFGTHALIQKTVVFKNLGFVIIDEQHRFGVRQRAELAKHTEASSSLLPHFLSMSATPIPRTLMLTVFGDLDLSLITELPAGRKPIETSIVPPAERKSTYDFIRKEVKTGRQIFVICPRIEAEDPASPSYKLVGNLELKSVKEEYEKLSKIIVPDLRIAMLHGQMKAKEKEAIMREFKDEKFDIMVATSVVEVGVDVPNATIMMIEGADRFGLAQLYQFRGRVGRGEHQSYCFLMSEQKSGTAVARLKAILAAKNGFELAEYDLKLRGPGQFFGQVQTGFPDALMSALQDPELVKTSREVAAKTIRQDPTLAHTPLLKQKMQEFEKQIHQE
jgi:ATP-dependent DNA helicase RecG